MKCPLAVYYSKRPMKKALLHVTGYQKCRNYSKCGIEREF
jgi:hypothetical protein